MPRESSGPFKLGLEVGGAPLRLGDTIDGDEWLKALEAGIFSRAGLIEKLLLGAGLSSDAVFSARNQDLQLFGGKVFVGPDLGGGPLKFGTSALVCFRGGSLHQLRVGISGSRKSATHFAKQCAHALTRLLGEPSQRTSDGRTVWWGGSDRVTLAHAASSARLLHEMVAGRQR